MQYQLKVIAQHYDTYTADFWQHYDAYCNWLKRIKPYQPVKINSQTGKDFFSFSQNKQLIDIAAASGIQVVHETHCVINSHLQRILPEHTSKNTDATNYTGHISLVCVAESFLDDHTRALQLAIARTEHIHARVGYAEGPQVPDPRAVEWREAVTQHLKWWDQVVQRKKTMQLTLCSLLRLNLARSPIWCIHLQPAFP